MPHKCSVNMDQAGFVVTPQVATLVLCHFRAVPESVGEHLSQLTKWQSWASNSGLSTVKATSLGIKGPQVLESGISVQVPAV